MQQNVPLTPAEQHLVKVILRHAPNFAAKRLGGSVPIMPACALRAYAVGLVSSAAALLLTIELYGSEANPNVWLFPIAVCLATKARGVKAGWTAAGLGWLSYFAVLVAPRSESLWQAISQPLVVHLAVLLPCIVLCATTTPPWHGYILRRRIRRSIASITTKTSASSAGGSPDRLRSITTS